MAFASTTIWEVQTTGNDSDNGGGFNPGNTGMATDLAATSATGSAASVTSASYSFTSRDEGHWVFIKSGTNWTPGWYKISSTSAGAATLDTTAGHGILYYANYTKGYGLSTAAGCATTASPTGGTWTIDYSQGTAIAFTDLVAATTTTFTSAGNPIGTNFVGNIFSITSGTGWNVVRWECTSVSGTTGTAGNFSSGTTIATGGSTGGTGNCGGPLDSPGQAGGLKVAGNSVYIAAGTYTLASASSNVATGIVTDSTGGSGGNNFAHWKGYATYRADKPGLGSRPVLNAGSISSVTMMSIGSNHTRTECLSFDGNSQSSVTGLALTGNRTIAIRCDAVRCTVRGIYLSSTGNALYCSATLCSGTAGLHAAQRIAFCESYDNTTVGIIATCAVYCLSYDNTGASSDGFQGIYFTDLFVGCVAYGNGRDGFRQSNEQSVFINCIAESNTGSGFGASGSTVGLVLHCGAYDNGTNIDVDWVDAENLTIGSGSFFTDAANSDFSLNNTAGAGAEMRAAGFTGVFPRGLTTSYADIGAAQHQDTGGGGGGAAVLINGGLVQ